MISESDPVLQGLHGDFLFAFTTYSKLKAEFAQDKSDAVQRMLGELEMNTIEKLQGIMERGGHSLVKCRTFDDFRFLEDNELRNEALLFLSFQYFRTKAVKESVIRNAISRPDFSPENVWNLMSLILATNVAGNMVQNTRIRFLFLTAGGEESFIATDQPVINLKGHERDERGQAKELEFFYPIFPKHAMQIDFTNSAGDFFQDIRVNDSTVKWFNAQLLRLTERFVFAATENELEQVKNDMRLRINEVE